MLSFDMNRISNNSIPMFIVKELRPNVEVMLVQPSAVLKIQEAPLIIMPHGGPHSGLSTDFSLNVASFVERGFACLLVNYTGSTGYGQAAIK